MSGETGTLERLALLLGQALTPLKDQLASGNLVGLFNELGLTVPDSVTFGTQIANAAGQGVTAATQLVPLIGALIAEIQAADPDPVNIVDKGSATITQIRAVIAAAETIATTLPAGLGAVGVDAASAGAFGAAFAERLFGYTVIRFLEGRHPALLASLGIIGIAERKREAKLGGGTYIARRLRLDLLPQVISSPATAFNALYGQSVPGFDVTELLRRLAELCRAIGLTVGFDETATPPTLNLFALSLKQSSTAPGLVAGVQLAFPGGWSFRQALGPGTNLTASLSAALAGGLELEFTPPQNLRVAGAAGLRGGVRIGVEREAPAGERMTLIGLAGAAGLRARSLGLAVGADVDWNIGASAAQGEFAISGDLRGGQAFIDLSRADGFVGSLLSGTAIQCDFDLGFDWSVTRGLRFRGSSALEVKLPAHITLGPVEINGLTFTLGIAEDRFPLGVGADIAARLGILDVVVEEIGLGIILSFPPGGGDIGPLSMEFGFKPPKGAGLTVDAGVIKGGGYLRFDPAAGEYFGALELSFQGVIDLKAFGIINTKFPDGHKGFAFLILVTAEFAPIQLGFGFTLLGVGGLLSLNRTLDVPALMTGVRTGSVNSLLFPKDVVANIGRIASDIKTLFPLAEGHFIVAPMAKLGWGTPTLITVEIGVILDIPEPQLVIVGVVRVALPTVEAPLILLQVNFAGGIDFDQGLLWFNASLFDSRLIAFTLAGDMALRIGWGARPMLIMSAGGFHPAFREVPDDLRGMRRMSISLLSGDNPRITVETYFAITSNTVQSGARVELYAAACGFNIYGFLGYDLLVQFNPLHFVADLAAGLALRKGTSVIAGISLHGQLSGPAPWNARGTATFEFLFFDISVSFDETWGDSSSPDPVEIEQVDKMMRDAIADDRNWRAVAPANATAGVSVRTPAPPGGAIVVQPFAVLSVSQKVAPLEVDLEKFGNKKPDVARFTMTTSADGADKQREEFAVANFRKMSDSEKLSAPSFERMISGLTFSTGDAIETGARVQAEVDYELSYVYRSIGLVIFVGAYRLYDLAFGIMAGAWSAVGNAFSPVRNQWGATAAVLEIKEDSFHVVGVDDLAPVAGAASVGSMAEALSQRDALIAADPALRNRLQVVASHELDLAA